MTAADNPQIQNLSIASARDERSLTFALDDEVFGFHVQQAVEKLLKLLITAHGVRYPFTHALSKLADQLAGLGETVPEFPMTWKELTEYALETRYEVGVEIPTKQRDELRSAVADLRVFVEKRTKELAAAGTQVKNP
jgi:HEPN domain-containing protein